MALDITLLQILKHREKYLGLIDHVPRRALQVQTSILLDDFGAYFAEFGSNTIEPGPFMLWFSGFRHPTLKAEVVQVYRQLLQDAMQDAPTHIQRGILARLSNAAAAKDAATVLDAWNNGDEVDLHNELTRVADTLSTALGQQYSNPQVLDPIGDILAEGADTGGLRWRLTCLNDHIRPLLSGDLVVVAGRPDRGKTTFCASELTFMATQVDALYPDEERSILWFNNEGEGTRIVTRCFQAALNATVEELVALNQAGAIKSAYVEALGGRGGVLRILDIHGKTSAQVESIIKQYRPALILFDMVDNIIFTGVGSQTAEKSHQLLEAMYNWARLLGVKYGCPVVATSQLSADADGLQYPTLSMLKDSKTGKQGAADVIITLGASNDPVMHRSRFVGTTKNKKVRTGKRGSPMAEVYFDGDRARYRDEFPKEQQP
jgi:replicative DNA helicase